MPWKFYTQNYAILWVWKFNTTKLTQFTVTFRSYKPAVLYQYKKIYEIKIYIKYLPLVNERVGKKAHWIVKFEIGIFVQITSSL